VWYLENRPFAFAKELVPEETLRQPEGFGPPSFGVLFHETHAIVALGPTVVLRLHRPIWNEVSVYSSVDEAALVWLSSPAVPRCGESVEVELAFGFIYGHEIPAADRVEWYSPDLRQPPSEVQWNDDVA